MRRNAQGQSSFIVFVLRRGSPDFVHEQGNLQFDLHLDSEAHESTLHICSPFLLLSGWLCVLLLPAAVPHWHQLRPAAAAAAVTTDHPLYCCGTPQI